MRTYSNQGYTITYPDKVVFAYNKNSITIKSENELPQYYVVSVGDYEIKCAAHNETTKIDISSLLKVVFDRLPNVRHRNLNLKVSTVSAGVATTLLTSSVMAIYGALSLGDRFMEMGAYHFDGEAYVRNLTWFVHFPFTVSYLISDGFKYSMRSGNGNYTEEETLTKGIHDDVYEADSAPAIDTYIRLRKVVDPSGTFDTTFDYTFFTVDMRYITRIHLEPCTCKDGWYFRWIDRHGLWMQYLFTKGTTTSKNTPSNYTFQDSVEYNGMEFGITRSLGNEMTDTIKCAATCLDKERFRDVSSILSSPYVEMFGGYASDTAKTPIWIPVKVEGTSVQSQDRKVLNQVEISVSIDLNTQSL